MTKFGHPIRFSIIRPSGALAGVVAAATLVAGTAPSAGAAAKLAGPVVTPGQVDSIVAADTATNNRANASLSLSLQDSHETCLQDVLDDATYRGDRAAGTNSLGGSFDQVPSRALVPRLVGYPAFFSVLAADKSSSQPTTTNLLNYVKTSSSAHWKLASSTEILGPTAAGVAVPAVATDSQGYVTSLDTADRDGLSIAPAGVAARVATAFTSEAASGKLPSGYSAQFGSQGVANPHDIADSYASLGTVSAQFSAATPSAASAGAPSRDCPYPAYRLADGGALVTFAMFLKLVVHVRTGDAVVQPTDRSVFGPLLAPGTYTSLSLLLGDMAVAVVPPSGSHASVDVIGQASEGLSETGTEGSSSSGSNSSGGPANAAALARGVDPALVDINTTLDYGGDRAAGTGMVLTPGGEVLTNNHVIEDATTFSVTDVGNGKSYGAKVVGYDRSADVAILQLEHASGLHTISAGDSTELRTGAAVVGVGNAGGSGGTPSYAGGSVTGLNQSINATDEGAGTTEQLSGLIETDADIQPGDSGGSLVNSSGKVVGMDTAASGGFSFAESGSSTTSGYAIPIDTALQIAREITAGDASSAVHIGATAYLGVDVYPAASSGGIGGGFGFGQPGQSPTSTAGAEIETVIAGSPAAHAGLAGGDTITSLGGHLVTSPNSLTSLILSARPGGSLSLGYVDPSGAKHTVTVKLVSGPPQ